VIRISALVACAAALMLASCGGGGGGGGGFAENSGAPVPFALVPWANVYELKTQDSFSPQTSALFVVAADGTAYGIVTDVDLQAITDTFIFGGVGTFNSDGTWIIPDAHVDVMRTSASHGSDSYSAQATITGTITADQSATIKLPSPPRPGLMVSKVTLGISTLPAAALPTIAGLAGHYVQASSAPGINIADFTIDSGGHLTGMVLPGCTADAVLRVLEPQRKVISAVAAFAGNGCPAGAEAAGVQPMIGFMAATGQLNLDPIPGTPGASIRGFMQAQ
jgi:hypothetical protein